MKEPCCFRARQRWRDGLPKRFACFCTLRTGAYVVAALSVVYALLLAGAPWTIGVCGLRLCSKMDGGLVGMILAWIGATLLVIAAIMMVVGASTGRRELLLPWLGFSVLYVALWLLAGIVGFIFISIHGAFLLAAATFFVALNMAVLPLYFVSTVLALYVRIGEESREAAERALGGGPLGPTAPPGTLTPPHPRPAAPAAANTTPRDGNGPTL